MVEVVLSLHEAPPVVCSRGDGLLVLLELTLRGVPEAEEVIEVVAAEVYTFGAFLLKLEVGVSVRRNLILILGLLEVPRCFSASKRVLDPNSVILEWAHMVCYCWECQWS